MKIMLFARLLFPLLLATAALRAEDWPQWRGPRLDGTSTDKTLPTSWSATESILWRTELPGEGHASPIVVGGKVFTVAARTEADERLLICLDAKTGKELWQTCVVKTGAERLHKLNSRASSTPACDGERVFTAFLDNREAVVAAHDISGKPLWLERVGAFASVHGFCSSPILYRDTVIVNCDHDGDGYIVALARADGTERWRIDRPNKTRSYCAPLIREMAGKQQMVVSGSKCVASYDPATGKELWRIDGPTEQFVASPVYHAPSGFVFITAGFPEHHLLAIKPDGAGDVTQTNIAWRTTRGAGYVPSPIVEGDYVTLLSDSGIAHCYEAKTGNLAWTERLGEEHASPISANGLIYLINDKGEANIIRPGPKFDLVKKCDLGERCFASPAASGGRLYVRTEKALVCIGAK